MKEYIVQFKACLVRVNWVNSKTVKANNVDEAKAITTNLVVEELKANGIPAHPQQIVITEVK